MLANRWEKGVRYFPLVGRLKTSECSDSLCDLC